jgi:DNA invertase Pin-like site-specific DNA recombinase
MRDAFCDTIKSETQTQGTEEDEVDKRRVALYARVSTKDQNPALQVEELRAVAKQRGWTVVGEFVDLGQSGAKERRPELDRLVADVRRGAIDVVVCWKFDRFARSVSHLVSALEDFRARGIDFVSIRDAIDTSTPTGKFAFTILAGVAELERDILKERVRAGMDSARRRGERIGRPHVRVDLARALALRAQGKSYRQVAAALSIGVSTLHRALKEGNVPQGSAMPLAQVPELASPTAS